ncbi:MAG: hypothetical protein ACRDYF_03810 [Acidimicrobiia bacterium]
MTLRRILAAVLLLLVPGCGEDQPEPARQAATEESELKPVRRAPLPAPPRTEVVAARFFFGLAVLGGLTADGKPRKEPPLSVPRGALAVASAPNALVAVGGVAGPDLVRTEMLELGATSWKRGPDLTTPRSTWPPPTTTAGS